MRVLLVEDDPLVAWAIENALTEAGCQVRCAKNGAAGLEELAEFLPEVMVTDRRMPGMGGVEFARTVRTSRLAPHVPLILISGQTGDLSASERALFASVLAKPISDQELLARVQEAAATPC